MGENSKIEWCDHTFNPWMGCAKVSDGCKNCYAEGLMDKRMGKVQWGSDGTRVLTSKRYWNEPFKWNREAARDGVRRRVFCASLADVFEDRPELVPWRDELFALVEMTPHLDWLLLTKRPENIGDMIPRHWMDIPRHNVWFGTSVENQEQADKRIPELLRVPVAVRFLSMEPLLGPVDFRLVPGFNRCGSAGADLIRNLWVIVGGESGPNARPMHPEWARSIRDLCQVAGVPFFFKQWGEWVPDNPPHGYSDEGLHPCDDKAGYLEIGPLSAMRRLGKKAAGRLLDGREWNEFPRTETGDAPSANTQAEKGYVGESNGQD